VDNLGIYLSTEEEQMHQQRGNSFFDFIVARRKEQLPGIINIIFFLESAFGVQDSELLKTMSSVYIV